MSSESGPGRINAYGGRPFAGVMGEDLRVVPERRRISSDASRIADRGTASRCPECGTRVKPYDNIPIVSMAVVCEDIAAAARRYLPALFPPIVEAITERLCVGGRASRTIRRWDRPRHRESPCSWSRSVIDLEHRSYTTGLTAPALLALISGVVINPPGAERLIAGSRGRILLLAVLAYRRDGGGRREARGTLGLLSAVSHGRCDSRSISGVLSASS